MYITTNMKKQENEAIAVFYILQDMGKVIRSIQNEAVLCEGVTFIQFCILNHIAAMGGTLELSKLHTLLAVEKSSTTRMVEPLVKRALIIRNKSENDSRAIELSLTETGRVAHEKVWECISGIIKKVLQHIPKNQRSSIIEVLKNFIFSIQECCGGNLEKKCGCD